MSRSCLICINQKLPNLHRYPSLYLTHTNLSSYSIEISLLTCSSERYALDMQPHYTNSTADPDRLSTYRIPSSTSTSCISTSINPKSTLADPGSTVSTLSTLTTSSCSYPLVPPQNMWECPVLVVSILSLSYSDLAPAARRQQITLDAKSLMQTLLTSMRQLTLYGSNAQTFPPSLSKPMSTASNPSWAPIFSIVNPGLTSCEIRQMSWGSHVPVVSILSEMTESVESSRMGKLWAVGASISRWLRQTRGYLIQCGLQQSN